MIQQRALDISWPNRNLGPEETLSLSPLLFSPLPSFTDEETDPKEWSEYPEVTRPRFLTPDSRSNGHGPPTQDCAPGARAQGAATVDKMSSPGFKNSEAHSNLCYNMSPHWRQIPLIVNVIRIGRGDRRAISS